MAKRYRLKKVEGKRNVESPEKRGNRWPWVALCLLSVSLVAALGVSSSKPSGNGLLLRATLWAARGVASIAGVFTTYVCFLLAFTSLVKAARPLERLPRFIWGLWTILVFGAAFWHDIQVPWKDTFAMARMGAGGGLLGASIDWFFRAALGRIPAMLIIFLGMWVGVSLLFNKSPYTPFTVLWMGFISFWQWIKKLMAEFFKPYGPSLEEIEYEALEEISRDRKRTSPGDEQFGTSAESDAGEGLDHSPAPGRTGNLGEPAQGLGAIVSQLKERLSRSEAAEGSSLRAGTEDSGTLPGSDGAIRGPRPSAGTSRGPGAQAATLPGSGPASGPAGTIPGAYPVKEAGQGIAGNQIPSGTPDDFSPKQMEQPPLHEDLFYEMPPLSILQKSDVQKKTRTTQALEERAKIIEKTLLSFGVAAKVVDVTQGPAVTRFELQPGPGVKVASIVNLSQDLALALAAQDVRIEAPIPGKSAVGIEVPNKEISLVHLRDVLETREFRNSQSTLTVALGKDISGRPVVTSLDRCVHLLIAGATGAGKSVCINSMIASLLYKARPDQVKMLLIDPKRVELSVWSRIPHLIAPVVTDPRKAAAALRWAIKEMEARYEKFTKVGTRDIERYNEVATPPDSIRPALPYIVIIIDELSDLMMVAPAEVEDAIFRLAQMARASGIYLVVATQRPSVDVLTGTIKANIPSRIAFAVSSQIDSRTILDMAGAEKLLGRGDMLFFPVGASKPLRAQGCYVSEREIDELVSFVSSQARPQYAPGVLSMPDAPERETEMQEDPLFLQALRIVVEAKQASVSLLQRKLPIGYSRAARLIDAMEAKGYVGPYEGSKPREVRMTMQEYLRRFENPQLPDDANPGGEHRGGAGESCGKTRILPREDSAERLR